jgi:hypothetical protein
MADINPKLENFSDRELLELIIANQVNVTQRLFRMNHFFMEHYGEPYISKMDHKSDVFEKLIKENDSLLQQIHASMKK